MKKIIFLIAALFISAAAIFAGGSSEKESGLTGEVNLGGSTTVAPVMTYAIEALSEVEPGIRVSYEAVGSSTGIKGVINDIYVLGGASRELKKSEIESGVKAVPVALDCLVMIVNSDVGIDNLTVKQLADIFTGRITNWKEVGGDDRDIILVSREESSGTFGTFMDLVIIPEYGKGDKIKTDSIIVSSNGDMVTKVSSTPAAIGYTGLGYVPQVVNNGGKAIFLNGIEPSGTNVKNGSYDLSRNLYLVYKGEIEEGSFSRVFLDFVLSSEGQALVKEAGFIPLK